jgi:hypothetical protein
MVPPEQYSRLLLQRLSAAAGLDGTAGGIQEVKQKVVQLFGPHSKRDLQQQLGDLLVDCADHAACSDAPMQLDGTSSAADRLARPTDPDTVADLRNILWNSGCHPRGLVGLHLSGNPIGDDGLRALVDLHVQVPGLELTSFSIGGGGGGGGDSHGITDLSLVAELLYQLGKRHSLQQLDISNLLQFATPQTTPHVDLDEQARFDDELVRLLDDEQGRERAFLDIEQSRIDDERAHLNAEQALLDIKQAREALFNEQARLDEQARFDKVRERLNKEQAVIDQEQERLNKQARFIAGKRRRRVRRQAKRAFRQRVKGDPFLALQVCIGNSPNMTCLRLQNVGLRDAHLAELASSMTFPAERQWDLLDVSHNKLRLSVAPEEHSATTAACSTVDDHCNNAPLPPNVLHDTLRRLCCCASLLLVGNSLSEAPLPGSGAQAKGKRRCKPTAESHAFAALARAVADACDHPELPDPSAQLAEIVVSKPTNLTVASEAAHLLQRRMHNASSAAYRFLRVVGCVPSQTEDQVHSFGATHPKTQCMPAKPWIAPDTKSSYRPAVALRQLLAPCVQIATRTETVVLELGEVEKGWERRKAEERTNYKAQTHFPVHVMRKGLNGEALALKALKQLFNAPASARESVRWSDLART